jgi:hypothetical protein
MREGEASLGHSFCLVGRPGERAINEAGNASRVPAMKKLRENDKPDNGLALCPNHHWAMDRFLIAPCPHPRHRAGVWRVRARSPSPFGMAGACPAIASSRRRMRENAMLDQLDRGLWTVDRGLWTADCGPWWRLSTPEDHPLATLETHKHSVNAALSMFINPCAHPVCARSLSLFRGQERFRFSTFSARECLRDSENLGKQRLGTLGRTFYPLPEKNNSTAFSVSAFPPASGTLGTAPVRLRYASKTQKPR